MISKLITPPAEEPVSLAEARLHCRVDIDDDDDLIARLIQAAREVCESRSNRAFVTQTWEVSLPGFVRRDPSPGFTWETALLYPGGGAINLPRSPLQSVTSVTYVDFAGNPQTVSALTYQVSGVGTVSGGAVQALYGLSWPAARYQPESVRVRYVAGYGAAGAVPAAAKQAILLLVGHWYANRETVVIGTISKDLEFTIDSLLASVDPGTY